MNIIPSPVKAKQIVKNSFPLMKLVAASPMSNIPPLPTNYELGINLPLTKLYL